MQSSLNSNQLESLTSLTCLSLALYQRPTSDKTVRLMARDGDKLTLNAQRAVGDGGGRRGGGPSCPSLCLHISPSLRGNQYEEFLDGALFAAKGLCANLLGICNYCSLYAGKKEADLCHEKSENVQ